MVKANHARKHVRAHESKNFKLNAGIIALTLGVTTFGACVAMTSTAMAAEATTASDTTTVAEATSETATSNTDNIADGGGGLLVLMLLSLVNIVMAILVRKTPWLM